MTEREREQEAEIARLTREIDLAWEYIEHGWDIEPRAYFEKHAPTNGFGSALAQAAHHVWKRNPRVEAAEASLASAREEIATWKVRAEDSLLTWDAENEARHDAEDRVQELEAELIRLRSISSPGGAAETPNPPLKP